jgi:PAS domain S-box-containing protein
MKIKVRKSELQRRGGAPAKAAVAELTASGADGLDKGEVDFFSLFDNLYHAVLIVDARGRVCEANRRAEEFFAAGRDQMKGLAVGELVYGIEQGMLAKLRANIVGGRYTVLNGTCIRRNGGRFAAEIALSGMEHRGGPAIVFSIRNESRVEGVKAKLRTEHNALQNAASGIVIADIEGLFSFVNQAFVEMWGFASAEAALQAALGDLWMDGAEAEELWGAAAEGRSWSGELMALGHDGAPFWVQAMSAPNRDETGQVTGMVFSFVDVSERYKAEETIRREIAGQIDQAREREDFSGLLNIIRLEDIFQLIDSARKSGALLLRDGGARELARIFFVDGAIVAAEEVGGLRDQEAIYRLFRADAESFEFKSGDEGFERRIHASATSVLLEALRRLDEGA